VKYNPTRPEPGQIELIQKKLWIAFAIAVISFAVMSSLPVPVAGLGFGVLALCYSGFQVFEWFTNSLQHGDIWRMNLRKNIESKYDIELPRIPDVTKNDMQPIKFTHQGTEYNMLFNQDKETFEPYIFPDASQQSINPEMFLKNNIQR
jgi:hypothetical protein